MHLSSFEVTGYKNLRRPVALGELAPLNVIHGENNVGKSNLLQAIDLFFVLLASVANRAETVVTKAEFGEDDAITAWLDIGGNTRGVRFHVHEQVLSAHGYTADAIFNVDEPSPITLRGEIAILADDWKLAGVRAASVVPLTFAFQISRAHGGCVNVEMRSDEAAINSKWWSFHRRAAALVSQNFNVRTEVKAHGFILVGVHRRVAALDGPEVGKDSSQTVPHHLLLGLYDAKESVEPGLFQRWESFERAMNSLGNIVGDGRFVITYNRAQGRAHLAVQKGRTRMSIESMGSGVQQIASLLARVLLANSAIVAIEEPELNLRYELQLRLRDMLREIVDSGLGPRQIIVTSHSPAFESGEAFYAMSPTDEGPVVEQRPVNEAPAFLQIPLGVQLPAAHGAFGYVSSDGLLRLPHEIRKQLGVEQGGGVVVLKRTGQEHVEIVSNEQFLGLLHGKPEGE